jgi:hypothetical protein
LGKRCADCHRGVTAPTRIDAAGVCDRCALRRHLDRVIPADSDGALHPLRPVILAAEPLTTRRWLNRAHQLLTDLHQGHYPLEHAALDRLPRRHAVEHLRALLISTGILPADPARDLRWLENQLPALLADLNDTHRHIVTRWIRWAVLPRLRRLGERSLATAVNNERRKIEQVAAFLVQLQHAGRGLSDCAQHDIDVWFAGPGAIRTVVRPFLTWTRRHRLLPRELTLPQCYKGKPTAPADSEQRWSIARRLTTDETLDPVDRVAGALIVLYAQPLARIVILTTADVTITNDQVQLRLGPDPLDLPEPFATLIRRLPHKRRDSTAQQLPNPWLFAGGHAGRHLNAGNLGARMRKIGIEPRRMRLAAADQLAREIPPAMLAGLLGLHTATATRASTQTSGQWANYAADRQAQPGAFTDFE